MLWCGVWTALTLGRGLGLWLVCVGATPRTPCLGTSTLSPFMIGGWLVEMYLSRVVPFQNKAGRGGGPRGHFSIQVVVLLPVASNQATNKYLISPPTVFTDL
jgi:hypothetical protein